MRGFVPLPIDVWMASLGGAGLRCEKEIGWNQRTRLCFDGCGKEVPGRAAAFFVHTRWRECGVFDEIGFVRQIVLRKFRTYREKDDNNQHADVYLFQQWRKEGMISQQVNAEKNTPRAYTDDVCDE